MNGLQYGLADQRFQNYQEGVQNNKADATRLAQRELCAILMTPFGMPYRRFTTRLLSPMFRLMPMRKRMVILYEFWGMSNFLADHFPDAFDRSRQSSTRGRNYGWPGMFELMAGVKFGSVSQVKTEGVYDIFLHVQQEIERERNAKKR